LLFDGRAADREISRAKEIFKNQVQNKSPGWWVILKISSHPIKGPRWASRPLKTKILILLLILGLGQVLIYPSESCASSNTEGAVVNTVVKRSTVVKIGFLPLHPANGTILRPGEYFNITIYVRYDANKMAHVRISVVDLESSREIGFFDDYIERGYGVEKLIMIKLMAPKKEGPWNLSLIASCEGVNVPKWIWNMTYFVKRQEITVVTTVTTSASSTVTTTSETVLTSIISSFTTITIAESGKERDRIDVLLFIAAIVAVGIGGYLIGKRLGVIQRNG
jgi:hypothetical protein